MKLSVKVLWIVLGGTLVAAVVMSFFAYVVVKDILQWALATTDITLASNLALQITFLFVPLLLGINGVIAFFLVRILQPIEQLAHDEETIAVGNLNKHVVVSKGEAGELGDAFNNVVDKLHATHQELEEKVKEKTAELEQKIRETERMNKFMLGRELKMIEQKRELDHLKGENTEDKKEEHEETKSSVAEQLASDSGIPEGDSKKALLNIMEDLQTERDAAQQERAKDEAILASIGDGLVVTDKEGKILRMNENAEKLLDLEHGTNIGKDFRDVAAVYDEQANPMPREERPVSVALQKGERVSKTFILVKKNDQKFAINITASPIMQRDPLLDKDSIIGSIAIIRDITKEREVDRMKTEFISLASHQLRTPLSAIKWFGEMLFNGDAGDLSTEQKDFVKNMNDSTERMIELVNSLLNISRIESGRIMIEPQPTDLKELVETIVKELQVKITTKHQTLIISVHQELPKINVDPKLIRQVYMNLLTNAIKYTPAGGEITVFISKKNDEVISQVTDNGYGIPISQQSKIFQRFFRAENIVKIETDGTGLGLYLIKAIIEASQGKIWFKSEEGKGTTFWFSLPLSGMAAKKGEVSLDS